MDVYDFDGTLYRGDSTADFLFHCMRKYPQIAATLPRTAVAAVACLGLHAIDKTRYKGVLYRFLTKIPDIEEEVRLFWRTHERNIDGPCHPKPGDVVISGSPEFLLAEACERRGLDLIASRVDPHTGRTLGTNCSDMEKVARFCERYPSTEIERFYSDSRNDDPLASMAKEAFFVDINRNSIAPWPAIDPRKRQERDSSSTGE